MNFHAILHRRIRLAPLVGMIAALLLLGTLYLYLSSTIAAAIHWRTHRVTYLYGQQMRLPFLWTSDDLVEPDLMRPELGRGPAWDDHISLVRVLHPEDSAVALNRWLYMHGIGSMPPQDAANPRAAEHDRVGTILFGKGTPYDLSPGWVCAQLAVHGRGHEVWIDCLRGDAVYALSYRGTQAHIRDARTIAAEVKGLK